MENYSAIQRHKADRVAMLTVLGLGRSGRRMELTPAASVGEERESQWEETADGDKGPAGRIRRW